MGDGANEYTSNMPHVTLLRIEPINPEKQVQHQRHRRPPWPVVDMPRAHRFRERGDEAFAYCQVSRSAG